MSSQIVPQPQPIEQVVFELSSRHVSQWGLPFCFTGRDVILHPRNQQTPHD